jgi:putative serine protease PepD
MSDMPDNSPYNPWRSPSGTVTAPERPSFADSLVTSPSASEQSYWSPPVPPHNDGKKKGRGVGIVFVLVAALCGGVVGGIVGGQLSDDSSSTAGPVITANPVDPDTVGNTNVAKAAAVIAASVVTIDAFGDGGEAVGTGVVISNDGEIVTNHHVVEGSDTVRVRLAGATDTVEADVLASDAGNDLALVKLKNPADLTAAVFADPEGLAVGDQVVAVGYALDLDGGPSVTTGIISALNRTLTLNDGALNGLVQTDAAISSGNSGGPLVNLKGEIVGINTAVARDDFSTAANNIGFAIGVKEVLRNIDVLRAEANGEKKPEGYLGVALGDRNDGGTGAVVTQIAPDSPAEKSGLKVDDVILEVNDTPITGQGALIGVIRDSKPGDTISMRVIRGKEELTLEATLVARENG